MTREKEIMQEANTRYSVSHPFIDIAKESFIEGAKWADKTMIEKACNWLNVNLYSPKYEKGTWKESKEQLINDFSKAIEE